MNHKTRQLAPFAKERCDCWKQRPVRKPCSGHILYDEDCVLCQDKNRTKPKTRKGAK